jgi:GT2 family glycosyltransferase
MTGRRVSFIVPSHNAERTLARCLTSIGALRGDFELAEILVVDDGSTDATAQIARTFSVRVVSVNFLNRAATRNYGARFATGDWLAFVDSDCVLDAGWLESLLTGMVGPRIGAAQGAIIPIGLTNNALDRYRRSIYDICRTACQHTPVIPTISAAAALYRKSAFDEVGGFDETFSDYEDMDLSWRLLARGYSTIESADAIAETYFDPPTAWAYLKRLYQKGRAAYRLFTRWAHPLRTTRTHLFRRCMNRTFLPPAQIAQLIRQHQWSALLNLPFVLSFRLGYARQKMSFRAPAIPPAPAARPSGLRFRTDRTTYELAPDFRLAADDERILLVNWSELTAIECRDFTRSFWANVLRESSHAHSISSRLADEFDIAPDELRSVVADYITKLQKQNIVVEC